MTDRSSRRMDTGHLDDVERYYTAKVQRHGATPAGVDWNSARSQTLRFAQLLRVCDVSRPFSILDYGCGYGALVDEIERRGWTCEYVGFDLSHAMIAEAKQRYRDRACCRFIDDPSQVSEADYVVASGTFNVKLDASADGWGRYVDEAIRSMFDRARRGIAFNLLTTYADRHRMRPDLYYADPLRMFDFCKRDLSRFVSLIHDYELFEFTLLVLR